MTLREEIFEQTDGLGLLELRGSGLELVLFLNDEPLVYDAADCAGSVGRFTVLLPSEQNLAAQMQIETNARSGFEDEAPLQQQIAPLLQLLPNGAYHLSLKDPPHDEILDWEDAARNKTGWVMGYYPEYGYDPAETLITTQPDKVLDDARINFYISEIKRGSRPALIVLAAKSHCATSFIIDGHHKLMAYHSCRIRPRVLCVEFEQTNIMSALMAHQILKDIEHDDVPRYLEEKQLEL